jgi:hypothetical protein
MIKKIFSIGLFFIIFLNFYSEATITQPSASPDFFVLTIPKSGSHLLAKLLYMLTNKKHVFPSRQFPQSNFYSFCDEKPNAYIPELQLEEAITQWKFHHLFPLSHFNNSENFYHFSLKHPDYVKLIEIRDLRDVCVSTVFFHFADIEKEIGPCTFDEKLMFIINLDQIPHQHPFIRVAKHAQKALMWIAELDTVVCRFENLVGQNGGGTLEAQEKQILEIASQLHIVLTQSQLKWITTNLFGVHTGPFLPSSFREGKIGSWTKYFKQEHIEAFKQHLGDLQLQLGYPLDF